MHDEPSSQLVALVERLHLATAGQIVSQLPLVKQLAGELTPFDMIWVDALAQARLLTAYQATEINAGRGELLAVGPYVLLRPLDWLGYADCFQARRLDSSQTVRLYLVRKTHRPAATVMRELQTGIEHVGDGSDSRLPTLHSAGEDRGRIWAASADVPGKPAADWLVESGRFAPASVLEIARVMTASLAALEPTGMLHGDISASALLLDQRGGVRLVHSGLRAAVRPAEGYAHNDLAPDAYDYLAPERITAGTSPTMASELYACGCLWWHLLAGRPPFAGGNSMAKLQRVHSARTTDIRRLAPDTPPLLAEMIDRCLAHEPAQRPAGFSELSERLGPPTRQGAAALTSHLADRRRFGTLLGGSAFHKPQRAVPRLATAAVVALLIVAAGWPMWRRGELFSRFTRGRTSLAAKTRQPERVQLVEQKPTLLAPPSARPIDSAAKTSGTPKPPAPAAQVAYWEREAVPPLVLPTDRPLELEKLPLQPGQLVRGENGKRPRVLVSRRALAIAVEEVTFENIDFVAPAAARPQSAALIVVAAARAEFRGCTFRVDEQAGARSAAIAWRGPTRSNRAKADWSGELVLRQCTLHNCGTAVEAPAAQRLSIELADSLVTSCGSLVRLARPPRADELCELLLEHVTLRQTGPVLELDYEELPAEMGQLTVTAQECTFALGAEEPLLMLAGEQRPAALLKAIEWQGQGSLVTEATPIAGWRTAAAQLEPLPDEGLAVDGLVRSAVEFAGPSLRLRADSRTVRWQVPLQSTEPPGISVLR